MAETMQAPPARLLAERKVYGERKVFFCDLIENRRGRAVRIKEEDLKSGRHNILLIPLEQSLEVSRAILELHEEASK